MRSTLCRVAVDTGCGFFQFLFPKFPLPGPVRQVKEGEAPAPKLGRKTEVVAVPGVAAPCQGMFHHKIAAAAGAPAGVHGGAFPLDVLRISSAGMDRAG